MERQSLFEKLKAQRVSFDAEIRTILAIYNSSFDLRFVLENNFRNSKLSPFAKSFNDLQNSILKQEHNLSCFLDFCELYIVVFHVSGFGNGSCSDVRHIKEIINMDLFKLGYKIVNDNKGEPGFRLKNDIAESVAQSCKKTIQDKIYEFLTCRNGDVINKRRILKDLADDFETIRPKLNHIKEFKKLGQFIQCVRHTKDCPKKEFPFYYENEESWLDKIFDMLIASFAFSSASDIYNTIIENENINS